MKLNVACPFWYIHSNELFEKCVGYVKFSDFWSDLIASPSIAPGSCQTTGRKPLRVWIS